LAGGVVEGLGDGGHRHPGPLVGVGGDGQLDVAGVLRGEVPGGPEGEGGDVLGCADEAGDGLVDLGEVREVAELVEGAQLRLVHRDGSVGVAAGELEDGGDGGGAHEVDVELDLRKGVDERLDGRGRVRHAREAN